MSVEWLRIEELLGVLEMTEADFAWYQENFREQLRLLSQVGEDGQMLFSTDTVLLLRGLSGMRTQGVTPEQIKTWFGLAPGRFP